MKAASGGGQEDGKGQEECRSVPGIYFLADCGHSHSLWWVCFWDSTGGSKEDSYLLTKCALPRLRDHCQEHWPWWDVSVLWKGVQKYTTPNLKGIRPYIKDWNVLMPSNPLCKSWEANSIKPVISIKQRKSHLTTFQSLSNVLTVVPDLFCLIWFL